MPANTRPRRDSRRTFQALTAHAKAITEAIEDARRLYLGWDEGDDDECLVALEDISAQAKQLAEEADKLSRAIAECENLGA